MVLPHLLIAMAERNDLLLLDALHIAPSEVRVLRTSSLMGFAARAFQTAPG